MRLKNCLCLPKPSVTGPLLCLALGCLLIPGAMAAMYKWVDADGQVHYTQEQPPAGIEGQAVKPPPPPASPEEAQKEFENRQKLLDGLSEERQKETEEQGKTAEDKAFFEENCRRAHVSLAAYQVPNALIQQPDGSRDRIPEEQRLAGLKDAEERIKEYCK